MNSANKDQNSMAGILVWPGVLLLLFVFILPLLVFFYNAAWELGSPAAIAGELHFVLTSPGILQTIWFTLYIGAVVTIACVLIAYPFAFALSTTSGLMFNLMVAMVVVPYFTSAIVRTYAWMVLLGRTGVVNQLLLSAGINDEPLQLLYNQSAIIIGMVYVLVPYMVLTLYAAMKSVDWRLMQAAESMGASGAYRFRHVFLPLTVPGIISGSLIVFILSIGFFITPSLMGGPQDEMITMLIEQEIELNLNWPLAAIMSVLMLIVTLGLYAMYYRFAGISSLIGEGKQ